MYLADKVSGCLGRDVGVPLVFKVGDDMVGVWNGLVRALLVVVARIVLRRVRVVRVEDTREFLLELFFGELKLVRWFQQGFRREPAVSTFAVPVNASSKRRR